MTKSVSKNETKSEGLDTMKFNLLSYQEISLLKIAIQIGRTGRLPSDRQTKAIYKIEKKIHDASIFI